MSSAPRDGSGSYEEVLGREDRSYRRGMLILISLIAPAMALYFDRWSVFLALAMMLGLALVFAVWTGVGMIRSGYVTRGRAFLRGLWEVPAWVALFGLFVLVQSHFGLWFAQHPLPGRYG